MLQLKVPLFIFCSSGRSKQNNINRHCWSCILSIPNKTALVLISSPAMRVLKYPRTFITSKSRPNNWIQGSKFLIPYLQAAFLICSWVIWPNKFLIMWVYSLLVHCSYHEPWPHASINQSSSSFVCLIPLTHISFY